MIGRLQDARVVLVCGKGGVGKTTLSAALALALARAGRRTLVCTIDPARRLANALGVTHLADKPRRIPAESLRRANLPPGIDLHASMLDTKRVFDEVVGKYSADADAARRILENPFYQLVSNYLAGSQEYMAVERLYQLHEERAYDCIVLDTPPSRHALDFLEAPKRISDFLESGFLGWILRPTARTGLHFLAGAGAKLVGAVMELLGSSLVERVSDFFRAFEHMAPGFEERASKVRTLLRSDVSRFVAVTTPTPRALGETRVLLTRLHETGFPVTGVVFNRVATDWKARGNRGGPGGAPLDLPDDLRAILRRNLRQLQELAVRDRAGIARLLQSLPCPVAVATVPDHALEVKTLAALARVGAHLGEPAKTGPRKRKRS